MGERRVDLRMPRFSFDVQYNLRKPLEELGVRSVFDQRKANLRGIDESKPLYLQWVWHQGRIEVDEEGTRAASSTGVMGGMGTPPKAISFVADHPFLFFIRDVRTGAILFIGRVVMPESGSPQGGGFF